MLCQLARHLADERARPRNALSETTLAGMRAKLKQRRNDLTKAKWAFRPDPKGVGLAERWLDGPATAESGWNNGECALYGAISALEEEGWRDHTPSTVRQLSADATHHHAAEQAS